MHGVDEDARTSPVRIAGDGRNVIDRADRVRRVANCDELGPRGQLRAKVVEVEGAVLAAEGDLAQADPLILQALPRRVIRVVVESRDNNLVAG